MTDIYVLGKGSFSKYSLRSKCKPLRGHKSLKYKTYERTETKFCLKFSVLSLTYDFFDNVWRTSWLVHASCWIEIYVTNILYNAENTNTRVNNIYELCVLGS